MDQIPRLTDLIPRSLWPYGVLLLLGISVIAGLEWLYAVVMPQVTPWTTDGAVEAFDLDGEGTLAVWFSSTTLLLASGVSVIVYLVRRYRRDDYQGRYRIWLWAAGCWLLMSLDETASLHEGFKNLMVLLTGQSLGGDGALWWAAAYFFLLGGVGVRLLFDMRECWLSTGVFLGVALCYATAVALQLEWLFPQSGMRGIMMEEGAEMLGDWLLLLAMTLHARHVILDAEGRLDRKTQTGFSSSTRKRSVALSAATASLASGDAPSSTGSTFSTTTSQNTASGDVPLGGSRLGGGSSWSSSSTLGSSPSSVSAGVGFSGSSSSSTPGAATTPTGSSSPGAHTGASWAGQPRRLTEAEKKALRRKLEKLQKQRQSQANL